MKQQVNIERRTIVVDDQVSLNLENLLKSCCRQTRASLRSCPRWDRLLNVGNSCASLRAHDLIQVRVRDRIRGPSSAKVKTIATSSMGSHCLRDVSYLVRVERKNAKGVPVPGGSCQRSSSRFEW